MKIEQLQQQLSELTVYRVTVYDVVKLSSSWTWDFLSQKYVQLLKFLKVSRICPYPTFDVTSWCYLRKRFLMLFNIGSIYFNELGHHGSVDLCIHLPSYCTGFKSHAHHLHYLFPVIIKICTIFVIALRKGWQETRRGRVLANIKK